MNEPNNIPYKKSVGEPKRGNFAYGPENANPAKPTPLQTKDTGGVVGQPKIGGDYVPVPMKSASVTGPKGEVETYASNENLSKKYKYPQVHQDVPAKAINQYNDHS